MIERAEGDVVENRTRGVVALVAEAGTPVGRATARRLSAEGATVAAHSREPSRALEEIAAACGGLSAAADLSSPGAVEGMVSGVEAAAGPVGVLVFNVVPPVLPEPFEEQAADNWWKRLDADLSGAFYLVRSVLPGMRGLGGGRIVLVASEVGVVGYPRASAYAASCAGLIAFGKTLGRELAPDNIIANVVAPGGLETRTPGDERGLDVPPVGGFPDPAEIAATVAFLAAEGASGFVGQVLQPNGGTTRSRA